MDKITRMLLLFSKLKQGQKINKTFFCMEAECQTRSFDRDIEDIRLYLSEAFTNSDLIYDRKENVYFMTGTQRVDLEPMEYFLLERLLMDTKVLRQDELEGLLSHLTSNTRKSRLLSGTLESSLETYEAPIHDKALLKIHGDLSNSIKNRAVLKINFQTEDHKLLEKEVIPYSMKYVSGYLYLIAFETHLDQKYPSYIAIDKVHSFIVIRDQSQREVRMVETYLEKHARGITQMYGGAYIEIHMSCKQEFLYTIQDKFREIEIIETQEDKISLKLWAFEEGFVKWLFSQSIDMITVIKPLTLRRKIAEQAEKIAQVYKGGNTYG